MGKVKHIIILFAIVLSASFTSYKISGEKPARAVAISNRDTFVAGDQVSLTFDIEADKAPVLFVNHSYGSTLLQGVSGTNGFQYILPKGMAKKTGLVNWKLVLEGKILLKGKFNIVPNGASKTKLENYLGPRSVQAGNQNHAMLVVVPTDGFDNPLGDGAAVAFHEQFLDEQLANEEKTDHFFAWRRIRARPRSGKITASSACKEVKSKEMNIVVYPAFATDFKISYERDHEFADGNQLTRFSTSVIKDDFGNVISDGTRVDFYITDSKNSLLKTNASTIKGIATAKILHPDHPENWKVKAQVSRLAESNELQIAYTAVLSDFDVNFSVDGRSIKVGPLKSFMGQLIPDGVKVKLHIYGKDDLVETKTKTSFKGFATFYISPDFYKGKAYGFTIESLGTTKNVGIKNYD